MARPLPTIAGVVRCTAYGVVNGTAAWTNVIHARYAGGASNPGDTEISALHALLTRLWAGASFGSGTPWVQAACHTTTTIAAINYTPLDGASVTTPHSVAVAGATATQALPSECAVVVSVNTAHRGKRYHGRVYLPAPVAAAADTTGHLQASIIPQIVNQFTGCQTALGAVQWQLGVASYGFSLINDPTDPHDKIESTWTPFFTPATTFTVDTVIDVQRRRKS